MLDGSLFEFKPPEGAVLVKEISFDKPAEIGRPVGAFTLRDASGTVLTPEAWRGSVVVLCFTGGEFVRDDLPFLELIHRALAARGEIAYVVTSGPDKKLTDIMTEGGYTVPSATDAGLAASRMLGMRAIPGWAILSRDGTLLDS